MAKKKKIAKSKAQKSGKHSETSRKGKVWDGSISFGLINIPVGVETAEQDQDLHFNMLDQRDLAHIKFKRTNEKTGKEVPNDKIVKAYHHSSGKYVVLTDEDFKRANPKASQTIDIHTFVKMEDIDPIYFERPYYLVPLKSGEKGYALLHEALVKSNKVAIATVVMRTKQHLTAVVARGNYLLLEILRFNHNLKHKPSQKPLSLKFQPQELKMAEQLVEGMTSAWEPDLYEDTYYTDLKKFIDKKLKAGKGKVVEEIDTEVESVEPSDSQDLMALLKASLKKKPGAKSSGVGLH
jgi:DNA end-binding protein Ku